MYFCGLVHQSQPDTAAYKIDLIIDLAERIEDRCVKGKFNARTIICNPEYDRLRHARKRPHIQQGDRDA